MAKKWGGNVGTKMANQSIYEESSTQKHRIGERLKLGERTFYYGLAAANCAAGQICSSDQSLLGSAMGLLPDASCCALAAGTARADQPAITASLTAGDTWLAVTHADMLDNITKNMLKDGYVILTDSGGVDQIKKIKYNNAMASDIVGIELYDEIDTATTDSTTGVTLMLNPWMELRPADIDVDENPSGVPLVAITADYYGWFQTWGPCLMVTADDTAFGGANIELDDTAGFGTIIDSGGVAPAIGHGVTDVTASGDAAMVILKLYP